ncbi:thiamine-phosphate kinase [Roseospira goensis]|uniref:Thiamine-monophosphate kinase n=1 Tax=Roseospira goensis TaxID=391922 RepID=A0A7W6RYT1_9PROT|nr:thiamine-phosphate kinase [Roseospira goensis]MBB4285042.1 thiamine-monophosphate kinase [Roseospira goensis]
MPRRGEFELISALYAPLARRHPGALGLTDDAAVLAPPPEGQNLVVSMDTLVSGVHFRTDDAPDRVARKALRVNVSDMAAMGAAPLGVLLSSALSAAEDDAWMDQFTAGLDHDLTRYGVALLGGDTVATLGPATFTVAILGAVPPGQHLARAGGRAGDAVWVSGTLGDAALGLRVLDGALTLPEPAAAAALRERYWLPDPPVALGVALRGVATAALDVSDGLVADLGHLCTASGVAAEVEAARVPLSDAVGTALAQDPALMTSVLTGGDDYQLLFTAPPDRDDAVRAAAAGVGVAVARIGGLRPGAGVTVRAADGAPLTLAEAGWRHRW